jgi:hypothetical protein
MGIQCGLEEKSCQVCREGGKQLKFLQNEYKHIFYLNDIVNFHATNGK